MPSIQFGADFNEVEAASNKLVAQLQTIDSRIAKVTSTIAQFNSQGVQTGSVIRGLTTDGNEFAAKMGLAGENAQKLAAVGIASALSTQSIAYKNVAKEIDDANKKAESFHTIMSRVSRLITNFLTYRGLNFVSNSLQSGIEKAKELQIQLSLIRTISQDNQQSFFKTGQDVRGVSDTTGIDVNKVGKAFYDTVSNQIAKGPAVAGFVKTAADLARTTGSELPDAVNLLSSSINAYGLSVKDADRLSAIFFRTVDEGRIVTSEMSNTFGRVAVLGANMGISIEDINSVLAITTQKGFKTADAMTLLTNLMIKLEKPTESTKAFFQSLGVSTGEAAIQVYGFTGVLRKMVDAVHSGQVDVSAFFDEIRGRKQFAVFQQSIDDIEKFSGKLKDTAATMQIYKDAVNIRGESPADLLVKETNKLKNVFTVDLGQAILKNTADFVKWSGGVDKVKENMETFGKILQGGIVILGLYAAAAGVAFLANTALAASAITALRLIPPLLAGYSAYIVMKDKLSRMGIGPGQENTFGVIDPARINSSIEALDRYKAKLAEIEQSKNGPSGRDKIDVQKDNIDATFRTAIGLTAQATIVNDKFLAEARQKSKDVSETLKVSFAGWTDTIKTKISDIKKAITEAKNELEKSQKSLAAFQDTIDERLFNSRLKYANDDFGGQKIQLTENKIQQLVEKATKLFGTGDKDQVAEGRKLIDEAAKLAEENFDRRIELQKKALEQGGGGTLIVSTLELEKQLNGLLQLRNNLETQYQKSVQKTSDTKKQELASEEARLRKVEESFKQYDKLDVFDNQGKIKSDFTDRNGKFDVTKLQTEIGKLETQIREGVGGSFAERLQLEMQLADRRKSLIAEANAAERADNLKTTQQRLLGQNEEQKKKLEDIRKSRQEALDQQQQLYEALGSKTGTEGELAGFASKAAAGRVMSPENQKNIGNLINDYSKAVDELFKNQIDIGQGVKTFDKNKLEIAKNAYNVALDAIIKWRDNINDKNKPDLTLTGPDGKTLTPQQGREALDQQFEELLKLREKLKSGVFSQNQLESEFKNKVAGPLDELKKQFPELADSSKQATTAIDIQFRNLANGGIADLKKQLLEIQNLMKNLPLMPNGKVSAIVGEGDQPTYAASGGIVGMFPGQPRGVDKYPIWAAADETIISAETSRMYRPMLDAIMAKRMPRYMADGGIVGGDTNIGDINITVNGATTNNDTGRAIGAKLERELRRRNIRLN